MEPNSRQFFCQHLSATLQLLRQNTYDPNIAIFSVFSSCCKTVGKNMLFNIPFKSSSVAGEVLNQILANFLPTFVSNIATFKKKALMTQTLHFFVFSSCCKTVGKNMSFNIPFKSSSVAGEVWNLWNLNSRQLFCQYQRHCKSVTRCCKNVTKSVTNYT